MSLQPSVRRGLFVRNPNKIREGKADKAFSYVNIFLLLLMIVVVLFPIISYVALAFNDGYFNAGVVLLPRKFTIWPFKYIITGPQAKMFWGSFWNSIVITFVVTIGSNLVAAMAAYALSKQDFPFRKFLMLFFIITMLFSAGIIPIYLLMLQLGVEGTIWAVILVSISNVYNMLLFKTFFEGLGSDLEEAARLDGANSMQLFFRVIIPLSLPVIGSCCFFTIVGTWNSYGGAMLLIGDTAKGQWPLAYYLYSLKQQLRLDITDDVTMSNIKNIEAAAIVLGTIPILCIYPYIVKYIKGGLTIGSVKG